jgi:putative DNA methylase
MVVEGNRERLYIAPSDSHEPAAELQDAAITELDQAIAENPRWFSPPDYGFPGHKDLYTPRQLAALTTFSDLISEARKEVERHARAAGLFAADAPLHAGGTGAAAYADAVATYLAFALSKLADRGSSICTWFTQRDSTRPTFARQAIPMTWDFAELNTLLTGTGTFEGAVAWTAESLEGVPRQAHPALVMARNAMQGDYPAQPVVISTDPPYYDNIGYADLSDFFYVWLRRSLGERDDRAAVWPELLQPYLTPKDDELVATPYRRGGKEAAESFFIAGMARALRAMRQATDDNVPLAIYYAFKQSETVKEGVTSPGWGSFLQAVVDSNLAVHGTWPLRTELGNRMTGMGANALASSIVLVCRKRPANAEIVERETFVRALRRELPSALIQIRAAGIGPVDMAQSAIGPGMAVFTRYAAVLEDSGQKMTVRTALALINQIRDELDQDDDAAYDLPTRFALDWFEDAGWDARDSGDAILAANARNLGLDKLVRIGLIVTQSGKTRLTRRDEMPPRGPGASRPPTIWQAAQRLARALVGLDGGQDRAAAVMTRLADRESVRSLAYRLYGLSERKGWASEALVWNRLAEEWRRIAERAETAAPRTTRDLFEVHA